MFVTFMSHFSCFAYLISSVHVIPLQVDACEDRTRDAMPGAADGARQYGKRLGGEEVARKHRGKTGILHSHLNADGTLLGSIEARQLSGKPTQQIAQRVVAENHGKSPEEKR